MVFNFIFLYVMFEFLSLITLEVFSILLRLFFYKCCILFHDDFDIFPA